MAVSMSPKILAFKADAALTKGWAVKVGSDSKHVAKATAKTDNQIGIAQNTVTTAEDVVEVALPGGGAKGLAGGSISAGDMVSATSDGSLIATTTTDDNYVGMAQEDAVTGDYFNVNVQVGII
jgi:hypothetical protein